MPSWNSRGLRGSMLEELINLTNQKYREKKLALITKIPTPITPIEMNKNEGHITLAYFDQKSTVDYIGVVQGIPVCFDAKECAAQTFSLANVHEHQLNYMREFEEQGGIAFLIIYYSKKDIYYYMSFNELYSFWQRSINGGRKSIRFEELRKEFFISTSGGYYVPYLEPLQTDLNSREG